MSFVTHNTYSWLNYMPFVTNHTAFISQLYAIPKLKYLPSVCYAFVTQFYAISYLHYMQFICYIFSTQLYAIRDSITWHVCLNYMQLYNSTICELYILISWLNSMPFYNSITCYLYVMHSWVNSVHESILCLLYPHHMPFICYAFMSYMPFVTQLKKPPRGEGVLGGADSYNQVENVWGKANSLKPQCAFVYKHICMGLCATARIHMLQHTATHCNT